MQDESRIDIDPEYIKMVNNSPIEYLEAYHDQIGVYYVAHDGRITDAGFDRDEEV